MYKIIHYKSSALLNTDILELRLEHNERHTAKKTQQQQKTSSLRVIVFRRTVPDCVRLEYLRKKAKEHYTKH